MNVDPRLSDASPARVGVDPPHLDLAREDLDGGAGMIFEGEAWVNDPPRPEVLRDPVHRREGGGYDVEPISLPSEERLDLEEVPGVLAVVLDDVCGDRGGEVRQLHRHSDTFDDLPQE